MSYSRRTNWSIALGWAITIVTILAIAVVTNDEANRSSYFWQRVSWTIFLATIVWFAAGNFLRRHDNDHQSAGGILPVTSLIVSSYATISFILMMLFAILTNDSSPNKIHLILQVFLAGSIGVICALISLVRTGASVGIAALKSHQTLPRILATKVEDAERHLHDKNTNANILLTDLKKLSEVIRYSVHSNEKLLISSSYKNYSHEVEELCVSLKSDTEMDDDFINIQRIKILNLQQRAQTLSLDN
jgi:uncharacterized membrane protein YhaH (DUF805 family)